MIDPQALIGRVIEGRYRLSSFLGDGSFGWTFAAEELLFDDVVGYHALKLLRPKDDDGRAAVMREIKTMAQLSHPRLIGYRAAGAVTAGELKGCIFLVMEMGGHSLEQRLKRPERMTADETLQMAQHVCEALVYLHERGAVHRDVKPGNVFRVDDVWKLGDFGLMRGVEGSVMSASGMKGTPLYLAPEAVQGQVGPSVDVWALGVMVHECLTGHFPYTAQTEYQLVAQLLSTAPQIAAGLPAPLDAFVRRSLERAREQRWRAGEALAFLGGSGGVAVSNVMVQQAEFEISPPPDTASVSAQPITPSISLPAGLRFIGKNAQFYDEAENEKDGTVLILIPAGTAMMGADHSGEEEEKPAHRVAVSDFWIARTPVTNTQFREFVKATGHRSSGDWESWAREWGDSCPVVAVSWMDAVAYTKWAGLRLPTEAEWEYAARGPEGREYPWGKVWEASRCRNSVGGVRGAAEKPVPVGSYLSGASPFGCLDMVGNVWEWCSTIFESYPYDASDGRERLTKTAFTSRVLRGGSWSENNPNWLRGAARNWLNATLPYDNYGGFRAARTF